MNDKKVVLLIDIGNTNIHFGLCVSNKFINYSQVKIGEDLSDILNILLNRMLRDYDGYETRAYISSVDRNACGALLDVLENRQIRNMSISPFLIFDYCKRTGLEISNYHFLGSDLFCDIIAAKDEKRSALVLDCGTCFKLLGMDESGKFLGGSIAPGKSMMLSCLNQGTDLLNVSETFFPNSTLMLSTEGAVSSGITFGLGGMAVKMIEKTIIDFKLKDCKIIVTGGDCQYLAKSMNGFGFDNFTVDSLLTLKGIALAFKENINFD